MGMQVEGVLITASTAGNLQLQWAQSTSDAIGAVLKSGSFMKLENLA